VIVPRRRFLLSLGAGLLAGGLGARRAQGASAVPGMSPGSGLPLRFVGVYTPHGSARELFRPGPGFDLGYEDASLAPFEAPARGGKRLKDYLLVIDGVDLAAGIQVGTVGHDAARVILTGSGADGKNASIDQFLAVESGLGAETPHTTLTLAVGSDDAGLGFNLSYSRGGTPVPKVIDPAALFDELFGVPLTAASRRQLAEERRRGRSVLDFVRADLARLSARAPGFARERLELHHTSLREIEKRLSPRSRRCERPERPDPARFPKLRSFAGGERYFETVTDSLVDLLARALACDLTRFSTLFLSDLTLTRTYPELPNDIHSDVAHRYRPRTGRSPGDPATWRPLALQNRHSYGKVARLMQRLDEAGVLADCLLYVSSDMGDPARHSSRNVPTLICGGSGGRFKLGRYLDLGGPEEGSELLPNNRILVSICQAFGVPVQRFGHSADLATVTGALAALSS
jgi:hypothetical protein